MTQDIAISSGFIFLFCVVLFFISIIGLIITSINNKENGKKIFLKIMIGSLIVGTIGYSICAFILI